jgi:hypothetical protein
MTRWSEPHASNTANLMLDEPPFIVMMCGLAGFMDDSLIIFNPIFHPDQSLYNTED